MMGSKSSWTREKILHSLPRWTILLLLPVSRGQPSLRPRHQHLRGLHNPHPNQEKSRRLLPPHRWRLNRHLIRVLHCRNNRLLKPNRLRRRRPIELEKLRRCSNLLPLGHLLKEGFHPRRRRCKRNNLYNLLRRNRSHRRLLPNLPLNLLRRNRRDRSRNNRFRLNQRLNPPIGKVCWLLAKLRSLSAKQRLLSVKLLCKHMKRMRAMKKKRNLR
jgi:hypothetical protein